MAFFAKKESILGVDIGTSGIKIVELTDQNGQPALVTYGFIDEKTDIVKSNTDEVKEKIVKSLKHVMKKSEATAEHVVAALPNYSVFSSIISLPSMSKKEMASAVRWEARKFVPMPIEDMVLDWKVINEEGSQHKHQEKKPMAVPKAGQAAGAPSTSPLERIEVKDIAEEAIKTKNVKVLLTAAPKTLVQRYLEIFKMAQLQLTSLETESFALTRALIGKDMSAVMVVDVGSINTNIMIITDNVPILNRSIDVGGETITQRIMRSLNIDRERAEQFKRDFGMSSDGRDDQVPKTIEFVIGSIINEIKYVVNLYQSQVFGRSGSRAIEKIILTGGSAFLPRLPEYLERLLQLKVIIGDPWARVSYPVDMRPVLDSVGPRLAVPVGLALRDFI